MQNPVYLDDESLQHAHDIRQNWLRQVRSRPQPNNIIFAVLHEVRHTIWELQFIISEMRRRNFVFTTKKIRTGVILIPGETIVNLTIHIYHPIGEEE